MAPSTPTDRPYRELAACLAAMGDTGIPFREKVRAAERSRRLCRWVIRANALLKKSSTFGLSVSFVLMVGVVVWPTLDRMLGPHWDPWLVGGLLVSVQVKLLGPMVDLETRYVQYGALLLVTGLFAVAAPPTASVTVALGFLFALAFAFSKWAKGRMKANVLRLMVHNPVGFSGYLADRRQDVLAYHQALGIQRFDDQTYRRCFQTLATKKRRKARVVGCRASPGEEGLPAAGQVRVEIWRRNPLSDLSSIRELGVCCFLGGSQEASAFDFMLSKSVTMMDFLSSKGRVARALLMACVTEEEGQEVPLLVANAVFGREGGVVGSLHDDNAFVREQIEAYARFAGFGSVLYNVAPANVRPRAFVQHLRREVGGPPQEIVCRLTSTRDPIKLEVFGRKEPAGNVYLMHLLDLMNHTDNYATRGRVRGYRVTLDDPFLKLTYETLDPGAPEGWVDVDLGGPVLRVDGRVGGGPVRQVLEGFLAEYPEMDASLLPSLITVDLRGGARRLVSGSALDGHLVAHAALRWPERPFWGELLFAVGVCQHLLRRLHPGAVDAEMESFLFRLLDQRLPDLDDRVLADLPRFPELRRTFSAPEGDWDFLDRLASQVLGRRFDASRIFKRRRIHAFMEVRRANPRGQAWALETARDLFYDELAANQGFREKYFAGLSTDQRHHVHTGMINQLAGMVEEMRTPERISPTFPVEEHHQVAETVRQFKKMASRNGLELATDTLARLRHHEERCRLIRRLDEVEGALAKGRGAEARRVLGEVRGKEREGLGALALRPYVRSLWWRSFTAPFQAAVRKLNLDAYW